MSTITRNWLGAWILAAGFMVSSQASANFSLGVGLNYNNGYPPPAGGVYPGYGYGGMGGMAYCPPTVMPFPPGGGFFPGGGFPGGFPGGGLPGPGIMPPIAGLPPAIPPFRTPAPYIPPHIAFGGAGWGPGFGSYPGPGYGVCGIPCGAGLRPMPLYPVAGGPALVGPCGGMWGTCGGGIYGPMPPPMMGPGAGPAPGGAVAANGILDIRSQNVWDIPDTAAILQATGAALPAPYTTPVMFPRNEPTFFPTGFYSTGGRDYGHTPRPEGPMPY